MRFRSLAIAFTVTFLGVAFALSAARAQEPAEADFFVEVIRFDFRTPITVGELEVGELFIEFGNNGPASPVDGSLTFVVDQLEEPEDCLHDAGRTVPLPFMRAPPTQQGFGFGVGIRCLAPGLKTFEVTATVTPLVITGTDPPVEVVDLTPSNDADSAIFQVEVVDGINVAIDIKPGSDPNCINIDEFGIVRNGVVPVAILTTATFDAADVDPLTVKLDAAAVRLKGKSGNAGALEDVDGDGDLDLVVHVKDWLLVEGSTTAELTGALFDGTPISGTDSVCVVPDGP